MRKTVLLFSVLLFASFAFGQIAAPDWNSWNWLVGTWDGNGSGKPGEGGGWFSLTPDLQQQVLVRKNHSEYPATKDRPAVVHDDLMIVYSDQGNWRADYWDSEGHIIRYMVTLTPTKATFVSYRPSGTPGFRLVYELQPDGQVKILFAMAPPGSDEFKEYVGGVVHRRKP